MDSRAGNCQTQSEAGATREDKPSALTGFLVGPGAGQLFSDPKGAVLRPFFSDGCSSSPDGLPQSKAEESWVNCCVMHDAKYWAGGTEKEKDSADEELETCIAAKGHSHIAKVYRAFVKQFGGPNSNSSYRWGYGWNYRRAFSPLTEKEQEVFASLSVQEISSFSNPLIRLCNSQDTVFALMSDAEVNIYKVLNKKLNAASIIESAKWGYYNLDSREFELKLKNCPDTIKFIVDRKSDSINSIENKCGIEF